MTMPRKQELGATPAVENAPAPPSPDDVVQDEEIARLAYSYWKERGCQGGSPEEDWFRAEQELRSRRSPPGP